MRTRFYCLLVLFLHMIILRLAGVTSRHLPTNDGFAVDNHHGKIQNPQSLQMNHTSNELKGKNLKVGCVEKASKYKEMEKIGSRPPSCESKCYGCMPCVAIQVPANSKIVGVQYTNYEPEGWKCKCGPTFYSP